MSKTYKWIRYIYNDYESDNRIIFYGVETDTPGRFMAEEISFFGSFNDGVMSCSIVKINDGTYDAIVDDKKITCDSFDDAWEELPAYLTHPDHFEESELFVNNE